jgi:hypothetical protein
VINQFGFLLDKLDFLLGPTLKKLYENRLIRDDIKNDCEQLLRSTVQMYRESSRQTNREVSLKGLNSKYKSFSKILPLESNKII